MGDVGGFDEDFVAFVRGRQDQLVRLSWALSGDRHLGEDLAQTALQRLWPRWRRVSASGDPLAYAQRIVINLWRSTRQTRRWRSESSFADVPERADGSDPTADLDVGDAGYPAPTGVNLLPRLPESHATCNFSLSPRRGR